MRSARAPFESGPAMLDALAPETRTDLIRKAYRGMAQRSSPGLVAYPLLIGIFGIVAGYPRERPALFYGLLGVCLLLAATRADLILRFERRYDAGPSRWRRLFAAATVATIASWATLGTTIILDQGLGSVAFFSLLATNCICAFSIIIYAAEPLLLRPILAILVATPFVTMFFLGGTLAYWLALTLVLYTAYLVFESRHLTTELWQGLIQGEQLRQRAEELDEIRRRLERTHEELARASQVKNAFLASLSHEVRTPTGAIIGLADLLLKDDELSIAGRDHATMIKSSGTSLLRLIDDLLDISKIEAGKLSLELGPFELTGLVRELERMLGERVEGKSVELVCEVDGRLHGWLRGDEARLRQVLFNLVGNAIKFTERGRVTLRVEPERADGPTSRVRFTVADTGIGIAPELQPQLFDPFVQADAGQRLGGSGLGLAISRRIVELMGGEIELESAPDRGSTFSFTIPLEPISVPAPAAEDPGTDAVPRPHRTEKRLLLVEDHSANRVVAEHLLRELGYGVKSVDSGRLALEILDRESFDLVLMDCQMPDLDGYETTRRLRRLEPPGSRLPVIALTAHAMRGDRERCLEAGMDDYLSKPFTATQLAAVLDRWLGTTTDEPAPNDDDGGVIDARAVRSLRRLGRRSGKNLLAMLADGLVHQRPLTTLGEALAARDAAVIATTAHDLKGSLGFVGAPALAERYVELEEAARRGDLDACARLVRALEPEHRQVEEALREALADEHRPADAITQQA